MALDSAVGKKSLRIPFQTVRRLEKPEFRLCYTLRAVERRPSNVGNKSRMGRRQFCWSVFDDFLETERERSKARKVRLVRSIEEHYEKLEAVRRLCALYTPHVLSPHRLIWLAKYSRSVRLGETLQCFYEYNSGLDPLNLADWEGRFDHVQGIKLPSDTPHQPFERGSHSEAQWKVLGGDKVKNLQRTYRRPEATPPWTWNKAFALASMTKVQLEPPSSNASTRTEDSIESSNAAITYPQRTGHQQILNWKHTAGQGKDWRQAPHTKAATRRQRSRRKGKKILTKTTQSIKISVKNLERHGHLVRFDAPKLMLRWQRKPELKSSGPTVRYVHRSQLHRHESRQQKRRLSRSLSEPSPPLTARRPKKSNQAVKHQHTTAQSNTKPPQQSSLTPLSEIDIYTLHARLRSSTQTPQRPTLTLASPQTPLQPLAVHHRGAIILSPYSALQLQTHLLSNSYHETYTLQDLTTNLWYEVKVYTLRGLKPTHRKARVENLKRETKSELFLYSFDFEEKKYCVFMPGSTEREEKGVKMGLMKREQKRKAEGGLPKKGTKKYDVAFPALPSSRKGVEHEDVVTKREELEQEPAIEPHSHDPSSFPTDEQVLRIIDEESLWGGAESSRYHTTIPLAIRLIRRLYDVAPLLETEVVWKAPPPDLQGGARSAGIGPEKKSSRGRRQKRKNTTMG